MTRNTTDLTTETTARLAHGRPERPAIPPEAAARGRAESTVLRAMAGLLSIWGLCANASCRRARACRGAPRACLRRFAPLVPPEVRDGVQAMFEGVQADAPFEEVYADAREEIEAVGIWRRQVEASMRPPQSRRAKRAARRSP